MTINKNKLLKIINSLLLISFIIQTLTIIVLFFNLKVPRLDLISEVHEKNGLLLIALAIIHVILNWNWIKANFFKK